MFLWMMCVVCAASPDSASYQALYVSRAEIQIDGRLTEPMWEKAGVEKRFAFPWKKVPAPRTEFRAVCDSANLYFAFQVADADIVVLDPLRDEEDEVFEDRVEMYFALDEALKRYYCMEVDSRGRVYDYRGAFYRKLDPAWNWKGVEALGTKQDDGYTVEGRIPLASLETLGFPALRPGTRFRFGLYRAEFSHDRSGRPVEQRETIHNRGRKLDGPLPIEEWISWIDPHTPEPDFHVPSSLGWLEIMPADAVPAKPTQ